MWKQIWRLLVFLLTLIIPTHYKPIRADSSEIRGLKPLLHVIELVLSDFNEKWLIQANQAYKYFTDEWKFIGWIFMINTGVNNFNSPMRLSKQTLRRFFLLLFNCDNFHKNNWSGFHSEKGAHAAFVSPCDTGSVTLLETLFFESADPVWARHSRVLVTNQYVIMS